MLPYEKIDNRQFKKIIDDLFTLIEANVVSGNAEFIEIIFNETKIVLRLWEDINLVAAERLIYCLNQPAHKVTYAAKVLLIGEVMHMMPAHSPVIPLTKNPTYKMYKMYIREFIRFYTTFTSKHKSYFGFNPAMPKINIKLDCYRATPEFQARIKLTRPVSFFNEKNWEFMYLA